MDSRRVIVPLKFSDGDLVRNLAGLKQKIVGSPEDVIRKIAGGELERFFYGIARDDLKDKIKTLRQDNLREVDILKEIAQLLGIEVTAVPAVTANIISQQEDLKIKLESKECTYSFPRGAWHAKEPIVINTVKYIKGEGKCATVFSIKEIIIDVKESETLQISGLTFRKTDSEEGVISVINANVVFMDVVFDGVRLETKNKSKARTVNSLFAGISKAIIMMDESNVEKDENTKFNKVEREKILILPDHVIKEQIEKLYIEANEVVEEVSIVLGNRYADLLQFAYDTELLPYIVEYISQCMNNFNMSLEQMAPLSPTNKCIKMLENQTKELIKSVSIMFDELSEIPEFIIEQARNEFNEIFSSAATPFLLKMLEFEQAGQAFLGKKPSTLKQLAKDAGIGAASGWFLGPSILVDMEAGGYLSYNRVGEDVCSSDDFLMFTQVYGAQVEPFYKMLGKMKSHIPRFFLKYYKLIIEHYKKNEDMENLDKLINECKSIIKGADGVGS